jgi:hypothetical protein
MKHDIENENEKVICMVLIHIINKQDQDSLLVNLELETI